MVGLFLDTLYGSWFEPGATFRALRDRPLIWQAALIVATLSGIDNARRLGFEAGNLMSGAVGGLLGWVILGSVLWLLSYCFGREAQLTVILMLTGFASLPWLLMAPAQALGGPVGALLGVVAISWFAVWQVWAAAVALDLAWIRVVWLIPLAFLAIGLGIGWLTSLFTALVSLS